VHRLAGNLGALPPDIVDDIVERSDGVPLFVEELTKAVVEAGADRGHASISAVPRSSLAVPATLHASLLGRLDRLGPAAKNAAQVGAAIGRDFSHELLGAVAPLARCGANSANSGGSGEFGPRIDNRASSANKVANARSLSDYIRLGPFQRVPAALAVQSVENCAFGGSASLRSLSAMLRR
jgi:hypothetical protein